MQIHSDDVTMQDLQLCHTGAGWPTNAKMVIHDMVQRG